MPVKTIGQVADGVKEPAPIQLVISYRDNGRLVERFGIKYDLLSLSTMTERGVMECEFGDYAVMIAAKVFPTAKLVDMVSQTKGPQVGPTEALEEARKSHQNLLYPPYAEGGDFVADQLLNMAEAGVRELIVHSDEDMNKITEQASGRQPNNDEESIPQTVAVQVFVSIEKVTKTDEGVSRALLSDSPSMKKAFEVIKMLRGDTAVQLANPYDAEEVAWPSAERTKDSGGGAPPPDEPD